MKGFFSLGVYLICSILISAYGQTVSLPDKVLSLKSPIPLEELSICQTDTKKVFGKNPILSNQCISLKEKAFADAFYYFFEQAQEREMQLAFFSKEGRFVQVVWKENQETYNISSFLIRQNKSLFVQCIRNQNKSYFLWKTKPEQWEWVED
ncbi:hypothetical protein LPTSP4_15900 [Leptospira ryugenii]|uniref:Uncharacterized protein n=1 Tax=Leptospira ryugenii TaxID=1917863 RepID=A0A2P2DZM0_9LEPT|nr:hypothetical protein [Leptospira ryugenii]GBF50067.1 hypothetical protein LPTSP4_15900 [Leptospira ryugenii]